jgi:hypothetical protein
MELNEIKKLLYKSNFLAKIENIRADGILYILEMIEHQGVDYESHNKIGFLIPLNEIGTVIWEKEMPAKLLIRYIISNEVN